MFFISLFIYVRDGIGPRVVSILSTFFALIYSSNMLFQYRTTRTALGGDPTSSFADNNNNISTTSNTGNNISSGHALLNQSAMVESDSEGDFPESVKSTDDEDGRCVLLLICFLPVRLFVVLLC